MKNISKLLALLALCASAQTWSFERWTLAVTPQFTAGEYSSSPVRKKMTSEGLLVNLQYLERSAVLAGFFPLQLDYKNGITPLNQKTYYLSLRNFQTPDALSGILTLRLDGYLINNTDPSNETDNAKVVQPFISYINYAKTFYMDFAYATSSYGNSNFGAGSLRVNQYTPSFGFGFGEHLNWMRLRLYEVYASNYIRAQRMTHTDGLEVTYSRFIIYYPFYIPNRIDLDVYLGNRTYAVDSDAMLVYNLGDIQRTGAYVQANWRLSSNVNFLVNAGRLNFTTLIFGQHYPYTLNYIYGGLTFNI